MKDLHYPLLFFKVISKIINKMQAALQGVDPMMIVVDLSKRRAAGPSIYHNTSLQLHLQNQSHPLLIDVWIIELSLGFSCFSTILLQTLGIVLYFTLTPFTTTDILVCICVNILPDCHRGDTEMLTAAPGMTDHYPVQAN